MTRKIPALLTQRRRLTLWPLQFAISRPKRQVFQYDARRIKPHAGAAKFRAMAWRAALAVMLMGLPS